VREEVVREKVVREKVVREEVAPVPGPEGIRSRRAPAEFRVRAQVQEAFPEQGRARAPPRGPRPVRRHRRRRR